MPADGKTGSASDALSVVDHGLRFCNGDRLDLTTGGAHPAMFAEEFHDPRLHAQMHCHFSAFCGTAHGKLLHRPAESGKFVPFEMRAHQNLSGFRKPLRYGTAFEMLEIYRDVTGFLPVRAVFDAYRNPAESVGGGKPHVFFAAEPFSAVKDACLGKPAFLPLSLKKIDQPVVGFRLQVSAIPLLSEMNLDRNPVGKRNVFPLNHGFQQTNGIFLDRAAGGEKINV